MFADNIPLVLALLVLALGSRLTSTKSLQWLMFLTINLGFFYWYWIPSIQLVNFPPVDLLTSFMVREDIVRETGWQILLYHFVAVVTIIAAKPLLSEPMTRQAKILSLKTGAWLVLASTLLLFTIRFASQGSGVALAILAGEATSREFATYYNISTGAGESLLALWEIVNIVSGVYLIALATYQSRLLSFAGGLISFALVVSFLATGTRSILILPLFAVMAAYMLRPSPSDLGGENAGAFGGLRYLYLSLFGAAAALASAGMIARFTVFRNEEGGLLANTLFNNNDMMRELVFINTYMSNFQPAEFMRTVYNFAQTPFSFTLPRFLGFDKEIPEHLVTFNLFRSNIDIEAGQGNVFPGLIGDFALIFGLFGPLVFALFILAVGVALRWSSDWMKNRTAAMGYWITLAAYLFTSFRNLSGSFTLVVVLLLFMAWLISRERKAPMEPWASSR